MHAKRMVAIAVRLKMCLATARWAAQSRPVLDSPTLLTTTAMKLRNLLLILALAAITLPSGAQGLPREVAQLIKAIKAIKGISNAGLEKTYLPDIKVSDLSLPGPNADLPIAALRRTKGALAEELLLSINFEVERNESGLKALEFLSWWVRDQSRGGESMQVRSIGLPPMAGTDVQLGRTLRFTVDWFYSNPSQNMKKVLADISEKAKSIELATTLYGPAFK